VRNPLKSEDAAFRMLLFVAAVAAVVIAVALLVQSLT
jgi:negative regulator of sigma E activity